MLGLLLVYLLVFLGLAVLLWAGTAWFQAYIYSEPAEQLYWRAPAAAGALTLFFAFWGFLAYRSPGSYPGFLQIPPPSEDKAADELWVVTAEGKEIRHEKKKNAQGQFRYLNEQGQELRGRPPAVLLKEQDEKVRFDIEKKNGYYKALAHEEARYLDSRGRVMLESNLGWMPESRWGLFLGNILLNVVHLAVWFVCCWLLLRYQWTHAVWVALLFWLIATFSITEMLVMRVERTQKERATSQPASSGVRSPAVATAGLDRHRMCMMSPSCTT